MVFIDLRDPKKLMHRLSYSHTSRASRYKGTFSFIRKVKQQRSIWPLISDPST